MKRVKLLHILHSLSIGGLENGVVNMANNIDPNTFEISLCCLRMSGPLASRITREDVRIFELNKRDGNDFSLPAKLYRLFKRESPHIVHTHNWGTIDGIIAARMAGVPVIIHGWHGKDYSNIHSEKRRRILIFRALAKHIDGIVALSTSQKEHFSRLYKTEPGMFTVINNGVDIQKFNSEVDRAAKRAEIGVRIDALVIGCVARLDPVKDHKSLLKAFSRLTELCPYSVLLLVGNGPCLGSLKDQAGNLHIREKVIFLGQRDDIPELLSVMDIYAQPSLYEGMSNTLLEAMAAKLPIVTTSVGGTPDIITHGKEGLLVPPGEPEALLDAVLSLIKSRQLAEELALAGYSKVKKYFSLKAMVTSNEELYKSLLQKKSGFRYSF